VGKATIGLTADQLSLTEYSFVISNPKFVNINCQLDPSEESGEKKQNKLLYLLITLKNAITNYNNIPYQID